MKVLFAGWHMHANQSGWIRALQDGGHPVAYVIHHRSLSDHYDGFRPDYIGPSRLMRFPWFRRALTGSTDNRWRLRRRVIPSITGVRRVLNRFRPDVIVVREWSAATVAVLIIGLFYTRHFVRYIQHPAFRNHPPSGTARMRDLVHGLLFRRTMTPVRGEGRFRSSQRTRHVPFAVETNPAARERDYCIGGAVRLFCVGKFNSKRKDHLLLLRAAERLMSRVELRLTFFGGVDSEDHPYYRRLLAAVAASPLADHIRVRANVPHDECWSEYLSQDVFVLPSRNEPAALSPMEAMANGLPVVCTTENGTRDVVLPGLTGFIIPAGDETALVNCLADLCVNPQLIRDLGRAAYRRVETNYRPTGLLARLEEALS